MKYIFLSAVALCSILASCSGEKDPLINGWTATEVHFSGKADSTLGAQEAMILSALKEAVVGGHYAFNEDGTYNLTMKNGQEQGTWRYSDDRKTLFIKNSKEERDYSILSFDPAKIVWTRPQAKAIEVTLEADKK
jgi:hypothetical protein